MSTLRRCIVRPHPFRPTQYLSHQQNSIIYGKRIYPYQGRDHFFHSPLTRSRLLILQEEKKKVKRLPLHLEMWKKTTSKTAPTVSFKSNSKKKKKKCRDCCFFLFPFLVCIFIIYAILIAYNLRIVQESMDFSLSDMFRKDLFI